MFVSKEFTFDAAHFLTKYHGKCEHLHGHTYKLRVTVEGEIQSNGLVLDFKFLKKIVKEKVLNQYDHRCLNDFFENPTAEIVCKQIWDDLVDFPALLKEELDDPNMPEEILRLIRAGSEGGKEVTKELNEMVRLHEIQLWETATSFVTYRGK
jgi:6-pyruvoyltetrahydropterin/6-carboxytetrahydropterin synthase